MLLYQAQHHDRLGDTAVALGQVERCIQHTPTLVEAYGVKARILKHAGEFALQAARRLLVVAVKRRLVLRIVWTNDTAHLPACFQPPPFPPHSPLLQATTRAQPAWPTPHGAWTLLTAT